MAADYFHGYTMKADKLRRQDHHVWRKLGGQAGHEMQRSWHVPRALVEVEGTEWQRIRTAGIAETARLGDELREKLTRVWAAINNYRAAKDAVFAARPKAVPPAIDRGLFEDLPPKDGPESLSGVDMVDDQSEENAERPAVDHQQSPKSPSDVMVQGCNTKFDGTYHMQILRNKTFVRNWAHPEPGQLA